MSRACRRARPPPVLGKNLGFSAAVFVADDRQAQIRLDQLQRLTATVIIAGNCQIRASLRRAHADLPLSRSGVLSSRRSMDVARAV